MNTRLTLVVLVFAALALPGSLRAPDSGDRVAGTGFRAEFVALDNPEALVVRRTGEGAINWLGARLVHEVNTALAKGGAEFAAPLCHLKSLAAGGQPVPGMPSIKAVKRTSLRLLNAANAPDAAEQLVLDHMEEEIRRGDPPTDLTVQRITAPDGKVEWRVYRALAVLPNCLACHGDPATQSPALQTLLREKAPANIATGYAAGDWRGVLRVTVAPPAAK